VERVKGKEQSNTTLVPRLRLGISYFSYFIPYMGVYHWLIMSFPFQKTLVFF
jgi:hypothetical protein